MTKLLAYIGSYAEASAPGVYACLFDPDQGELEVTDQVTGLLNPTFLALAPERRTLYAIGESRLESGERMGEAAAYRLDPETGKLRLLNRQPTVAAPTCHISIDKTGQALFTSSYHGGLIGVSALEEDGRVGPLRQTIAHSGSSVLPVQSQARVHSLLPDRSNRFAVVCDLGLDKVTVYRIDPEGPTLTKHSETSTAAGAGPRHFAFHPSRPYGYVINELNSTVTVFSWDEENGTLTEIETVSTLPSSYDGENATADIHLSPDGRFLYGSNRGHDSLAVFAVDEESGRLRPVEHTPTGGGHPRNFALTPDGRFLLAANRDGDNIVIFRRDSETGRLTPNGKELRLPKPVCVKFMER